MASNERNNRETEKKSSSLPKAIKTKQGITKKEIEIAKEFNKYFTSVDTALASKIPVVTKDVSEYLPQCNASMEHKELSFQEFEKAFKTLKRNKAIGYDGLNGNIIMDVYDSIKVILFKIFKASLEEAVFPEKLKIAKVIPVFKKGDKENIENYQPISILPVFSKVLERIMYNRLYEYFMNNNLLHENQFGFQINNSPDHAILQFTCDIAQNFDNGKFTLGVFIDLSKAFDTVDHQILVKKLKHYGVNEKTLTWLRSYVFQRKQYIENSNAINYLLEIDCGVPHWSILGPLLFLIYVNDFYLASKLKMSCSVMTQIYLFLYFFIYLFIYLIVYLFIYLFIYSFIHSFNYLFIYLFLYIYLFIYIFISDGNMGELFQQMNK